MTILLCHQHLITNSVQQLLIRHTVKCKFMPHALSKASSCTEHVSSPLAPPTHNRTSSTTSTSPQRCWLGSGLSWTALPSAVLSFGKLEKERDLCQSVRWWRVLPTFQFDPWAKQVPLPHIWSRSPFVSRGSYSLLALSQWLRRHFPNNVKEGRKRNNQNFLSGDPANARDEWHQEHSADRCACGGLHMCKARILLYLVGSQGLWALPVTICFESMGYQRPG